MKINKKNIYQYFLKRVLKLITNFFIFSFLLFRSHVCIDILTTPHVNFGQRNIFHLSFYASFIQRSHFALNCYQKSGSIITTRK